MARPLSEPCAPLQTFPDGRIIVHFFNGDVKEAGPDGEVAYYYAEAGTRHITKPDATEVFEFANGQTETPLPDGTQVRAPPRLGRKGGRSSPLPFLRPLTTTITTLSLAHAGDSLPRPHPEARPCRRRGGDVLCRRHHSTRFSRRPERHRLSRRPARGSHGQLLSAPVRGLHNFCFSAALPFLPPVIDWLTLSHLAEPASSYPDGTLKIVYADGRQETQYASGRVRVKDADGNLIVDKIAPGATAHRRTIVKGAAA